MSRPRASRDALMVDEFDESVGRGLAPAKGIGVELLYGRLAFEQLNGLTVGEENDEVVLGVGQEMFLLAMKDHWETQLLVDPVHEGEPLLPSPVGDSQHLLMARRGALARIGGGYQSVQIVIGVNVARLQDALLDPDQATVVLVAGIHLQCVGLAGTP